MLLRAIGFTLKNQNNRANTRHHDVSHFDEKKAVETVADFTRFSRSGHPTSRRCNTIGALHPLGDVADELTLGKPMSNTTGGHSPRPCDGRNERNRYLAAVAVGWGVRVSAHRFHLLPATRPLRKICAVAVDRLGVIAFTRPFVYVGYPVAVPVGSQFTDQGFIHRAAHLTA